MTTIKDCVFQQFGCSEPAVISWNGPKNETILACKHHLKVYQSLEIVFEKDENGKFQKVFKEIKREDQQ